MRLILWWSFRLGSKRLSLGEGVGPGVDAVAVVLGYSGSVGRVFHIFNLSLCTILVRLLLIANFTLLFPNVSNIL